MCTFTVDAAGELSTRLAKRFQAMGEPFPADRVRVGTFDSLALGHLKTAGRMNLKLLSPKAQGPKLRQIIQDMDLGAADELLPWFEMYQSTLDRSVITARIQENAPMAMTLIHAYYEWLRAAGLMDLATVKRTCAEGMAAGRIPLFRCTDLLVDEAQDSDQLQMLMARTHGTSDVKTTLVGDDDQTIYDWRSAIGYKGMKQFADECSAEIVRLGDNFRSRSEIVAAATRLIAFNNPNRIDKKQESRKGPGGSVEALSFTQLTDECKWVAEDILAFAKPPYDCAILARTNRALDTAEASLTAAGIPYSRAGSSLWDRDDIASYLGFMRFVLHGELLGLSLGIGYIGVSSSTLNALMIYLKEGHLKLYLAGQTDGMSVDDPHVGKLMTSISTMCARWRLALKNGEIPTVIGESINEYVRWAKEFDVNSSGDNSKRILRLVSGLVHVEAALSRLQGKLSERISVLVNSKKREPEPGTVRMMTMHASKGLEFDDVYLVDCAETEEDSSVSEGPAERRIMYVAMTRAREKLRISYGGQLPIFLREAGLTINKKPSPATAEEG